MYKRQVSLSFAGEERTYVEKVANLLQEEGVKVFYDKFEEADLWGKDLYEHLSDVYLRRARFTVMFLSRAYAQKVWTSHERKAAQAKAFNCSEEYILPVRFDETEIPGVLPTTAYLNAHDKLPEEMCIRDRPSRCARCSFLSLSRFDLRKRGNHTEFA